MGVPVLEDDEEEWIPHVSGVPAPLDDEKDESQGSRVAGDRGAPPSHLGEDIDVEDVRLSLRDLEECSDATYANPPPVLPSPEKRPAPPRPPLPVRRPVSPHPPGAETEQRGSPIDFAAVLGGPARASLPGAPHLSAAEPDGLLKAPAQDEAASSNVSARPVGARHLFFVLVGIVLGGAAWVGWRYASATSGASVEGRNEVTLATTEPASGLGTPGVHKPVLRAMEPALPPDDSALPSEPEIEPADVASVGDSAEDDDWVYVRPLCPGPMPRREPRRRPAGNGAEPGDERRDVEGNPEPHTRAQPRVPETPTRVEPIEASAPESPAAHEETGVANEESPTELPPAAEPSADLPLTPSREQVQAALSAVRSAVQACVEGRGTVRVRVSVARSGRVTTALVEDPYWARPPTGTCIARAVRTARFPPFVQDRFVVVYPFTL